MKIKLHEQEVSIGDVLWCPSDEKYFTVVSVDEDDVDYMPIGIVPSEQYDDTCEQYPERWIACDDSSDGPEGSLYTWSKFEIPKSAFIKQKRLAKISKYNILYRTEFGSWHVTEEKYRSVAEFYEVSNHKNACYSASLIEESREIVEEMV